MATWRKVIISGSNASLNTVTASSAVQVGSNQYITTSPSTTYLSGSFSGSFYGGGVFTGTVAGTIGSATSASVLQITDDQNSNATRYITFVNLTTGHLSQSIDSTGLTYNPSSNLISSTASWASNASSIVWSGITNVPSGIISSSTIAAAASQGQITYTSNSVSNTITVTSLGSSDSPSFANVGASAASFNLATSATTITIGSATSTASFQGSVVVNGGLTINGTTTIVNTTNLNVKDQFILLASGSTGNVDGGIIVGNSSTNYLGEALYWENSAATNTTGRWAIASNIDASSTGLNIVANSYLVTVSGSTVDPGGSPTYGSGSAGIGNMYVNTTTSDIWIWA